MIGAMRFAPWTFALVFAVATATALSLGCGVGSGPLPLGNDGGSGGATTGAGTGGEGGTLFGEGGSVPSKLTLQPESATITVVDGVALPVDFDVYRDGDLVPQAKWFVDYSSIIGVDADGVVTATAKKGGTAHVTAKVGNASATATVTVELVKTSNAAGIDPAAQGLLEAAKDPDGATQWAYPYDGTVFPQGLAAPELMWNGGGADDAYLVRIRTALVDVKVFTKAPPPSRFTLDAESWIQLTDSGGGGPATLTVARLAPGAASATLVAEHAWTIAPGSLKGTVYYWANNLGRIVRIKPGAQAPEDFLAAAGIESPCSTCHTVSANGATLVIGGDVATSTFDLIKNEGVFGLAQVGKAVRNWAMPAVSPNGKYVVENNAALPGPPGGSDGMFDALTGAKIPGTGLDGVLLDMPAFGPAGTKLAYVSHTPPRDLAVYEYDQVANVVSNPKTLVAAGDDPSLNAIAFPSVSPTVKGGEFNQTSTWIVYHRGKYPDSLDTRFGPGDLYLASADQPGIEIRLGAANGDGYPFAAGDRDRGWNYEPTFAPEPSGGYFWVVFTSRRTYGNRLTGGKDAVKQLWVTAIDEHPAPGKDPSHPAFWVPGQDMGTLNMRGYWALDPCVPQGGACTSDFECCSKNCVNGTCTGPNPNECAGDGEACTTDDDCCDPEQSCIKDKCGKQVN